MKSSFPNIFNCVGIGHIFIQSSFLTIRHGQLILSMLLLSRINPPGIIILALATKQSLSFIRSSICSTTVSEITMSLFRTSTNLHLAISILRFRACVTQWFSVLEINLCGKLGLKSCVPSVDPSSYMITS